VMETRPENAIFALQGPKAAAVLQSMTDTDLSRMGFMDSATVTVDGVDCFVARSGYTGEDGFEIAVPAGSGAHNAISLWENLTGNGDVMPIGLGARDSLRLESGLCLYGNDLDDTTSPVEGSLLWTIAKRRRGEPGSFVGSERILAELADKKLVTRKRVGFVVPKGAPVREGTALQDADGKEVGIVTSGGFSPCIKKGIGMCYVPRRLMKAGSELFAEVRGKQVPIEVTKMPLVPQTYYRVPE